MLHAFSGHSVAAEPAVAFRQEFAGEGDWTAVRAAEHFLAERGFSYGPTQGHDPRAIMFGDYLVAKWRNLTRNHIATNHGVMTGRPRTGPITVTIYETAPAEARKAVLS